MIRVHACHPWIHGQLWTALAPVSSFGYLERVLLAADDNYLAALRNFRWLRQKWDWMARLLDREWSDAWKLGMIYIAVVQAVMLYWSESWVMSPRIDRTLGGFHHRVYCRLTVQKPRRVLDVTWLYPLWRRILWIQVCRRWRHTFPAARTQLHSTFRPGPLWTFVWRRSNTRGQGCLSGGGGKRSFTSRRKVRQLWGWNGGRDRGGGIGG